eukprot:CAMPEP_0167754360 /NCGR_PEP_ID=MMETSP0110_2-20121227/8225_1 /TAXON_ID=629695 /ORGANISM="Gymnochlora sp., Strain CCMP2014" /LENGTH=529 /DNA_ID=CAMNT_0007640227 /DNA_START=280 /DNA_END=1870 /DNA_ORIENTATION=-
MRFVINNFLKALVFSSKMEYRDAMRMAEDVYSQMQDRKIAPNNRTITKIFQIIANGSSGMSVDEVEQWETRFRESGLEPDVMMYNTLLAAYSRIGDLEKVEKLMEEMKGAGFKEDIATHTSIMSCLGRGKKPLAAEKYLYGLFERGIDVDLPAIGAVLTAWARVGNVEAAENLFKDIIERGFSPNDYIFNSLQLAAMNADNVSRAMFWLEEMVEYGVKPTQHTVAILAKGFRKMKGNDAVAIIDLLGKLKSPSTPTLYNEILCQLAVIGNIKDAELVVDKMLEDEVLPDEVTFLYVIKAAARSRRADIAEKWLLRMKRHNIPADAKHYSTVINCFANMTNVEKMQEWFWRMQEASVEPTGMTVAFMISGFVKADNVDLAMDWLRKMHNEKLVSENPVHYQTLIQYLTKNGKVDSLMEVALSMPEEVLIDLRHFFYFHLINACKNQRNASPARKLLISLTQLRKSFIDSKNSTPKLSTNNFRAIETLVAKELKNPRLDKDMEKVINELRACVSFMKEDGDLNIAGKKEKS